MDAITKKAQKLTPFEIERNEALRKIIEFKEACEANIVSIFYVDPERLYDCNLKTTDFSLNIWRVYFQVAYDIFLVEKKSVLDEITVGLYLEKHLKLKAKYEEYGGFYTIKNAGTYVKVENLDGYIHELRKWNAVIKLAKRGFPVKDRLSDFCDMTAEEIYDEYEAFLNDIFVSVDSGIKTYNAFEGLHDLIDELDKGRNVGMPLSNAEILSNVIGGINMNGHIYGLGASSGVGKSTMAINYLFPSLIKHNTRAVFIVNEEDETKFKQEAIIWCCTNILKKPIPKYKLRDGKFDKETKETLKEAATWLEKKKEDRHITIIPLERYTAKTVIKIIRKYSSAFGISLFVLDTLKESSDSRNIETWKSMERDMVDLYDTVKPTACNVSLFVTYQLGKSAIKVRYLTNAEIGQSRSIVDVMSCNLLFRRPFDDEYEDGNKAIKAYKLEGKNNKTKIPFKLKRDKHYLITFVAKNRFGVTDEHQIVSYCDLSVNDYRDLGICNVSQDW